MPSVRLLDCALATYAYFATQVNPVASATDWLSLIGVTGKKVQLRWLQIGGTAAAARSQPVALIRRSTLNTSGTSSSPTPVPIDSADGAAGATLKLWSANPTLGTSAGLVDGGSLALVVLASLQDRLSFSYEQTTLKDPAVNNSNESLNVNFAQGTPVNTIATDKLDVSMQWTEVSPN